MQDFYSHRFYARLLPEVGEVVMGQCTSVHDFGANVTLLEYAKKESFLALAELCAVRARRTKHALKPGDIREFVVLRVDAVRGYVDLSRKRLSAEEKSECKDRFEAARRVHSIIHRVAELSGVPLTALYEGIVWPLAVGTSPMAVFRNCASEEGAEEALRPVSPFLSTVPCLRSLLLTEVRRRLSSLVYTARVQLKVCCYGSEGVAGVKRALRAGARLSPSLSITVVAAPLYEIRTGGMSQRATALALLHEVVHAVREELGGEGSLVVEEGPLILRDVVEEESEVRSGSSITRGEKEDGGEGGVEEEDEENEEDEGEGEDGDDDGGEGEGSKGEGHHSRRHNVEMVVEKDVVVADLDDDH